MLIDDHLPEAGTLKCLIDRLCLAESPAGAFREFSLAVGGLGFHGAMLASRVSGPDWRETFAETTYPEDWIKHYVAGGYTCSDPVRKYGMYAVRPYFWTELYPHIRKKDMRIFQEAREFGLVSGVMVPLYERASLAGAIGLASASEEVEDRRLLTTLGVAGQLFLAVYEDIVRREGGLALEVNEHVSFTKTEKAILHRMVAGATNAEIADATHVSLGAVEFHVGNIFVKLKARNRVSAVVSAIKLGIVSPE